MELSSLSGNVIKDIPGSESTCRRGKDTGMLESIERGTGSRESLDHIQTHENFRAGHKMVLWGQIQEHWKL